MAFLSGLLNTLNPGNIIKGLVVTGSGLLDNISQGRPIDISGNISKGIKTAFLPEVDKMNAANLQAAARAGQMITDKDAKNAANVMNKNRLPDLSERRENYNVLDSGGIPDNMKKAPTISEGVDKIKLPKTTLRKKQKKTRKRRN